MHRSERKMMSLRTTLFSRVLKVTAGFFLLGIFPAITAAAPSMPAQAFPHTKVEFLTNARTVQVGKSFWVGFYFHLESGWHIYWKNPGDSGSALESDFSGSDRTIKVEAVAWPTPKRIPVAHLANFGYEGDVLLPMQVTWVEGANPAGKTIRLKAKADWLICKKECVPGSGTFEREFQIGAKEVLDPSLEAAFRGEIAKLPSKNGAVFAGTSTDAGEDLVLRFLVPKIWTQSVNFKADFFPNHSRVLAAASVPRTEVIVGSPGAEVSEIVLQIQKHPGLSVEGPAEFGGVLHLESRNGKIAYEVQVVPRQGNVPVRGGGGAKTLGTAEALTFGILLSALIGGLLLNLMPCVFPVLSLKLLSVLSHSQGSKRQAKREALGFSLGVIVSFLLLGAVFLLLRISGSSLGWGFQLVSPAFLFGMSLLFFILGFNFLGWIEVEGSALLRWMPKAQGSFWNGVLATLVATPCTAPFMGAALGAALSLPSLPALSVFVAMGLGMAIPYLLIGFFPALLKFLPRPGAWMETLKEFLAFPMFGSSVWLAWLLLESRGPKAWLWLQLTFIILGIVVWGRKKFSAKAVFKRRVWTFSAFLLVLAVFAFGNVFEDSRVRMSMPADVSKGGAVEDGQWRAYTPNSFAEAIRSGKPVFIDFTASWCISCQVNKKVVLETKAASAIFNANGVITLRADWTEQDAVITKHLEKLGRRSVPTYALYSGGQNQRVILLPEVLTLDGLRESLKSLSKE